MRKAIEKRNWGLASDELVLRDSGLMALHMQDCRRARGRFFGIRSGLEQMKMLVVPRIVTSFVFVLACGVTAYLAVGA